MINYCKKNIAHIVLILISVGVIILFSYPETNTLSNSILPVVTIFYVYYTFQILKTTGKLRPKPYIDISNIIITNDLEKIQSKYGENIIEDSMFTAEKQFFAESGAEAPKNYIFLKIENLGERHALELKIRIIYNKKNYKTEAGDITREYNIGILKSNKTKIKLFEVFDRPTENDEIKITECVANFSDYFTKNSEEKELRNTIDHMEAVYLGEQVLVKYK